MSLQALDFQLRLSNCLLELSDLSAFKLGLAWRGFTGSLYAALRQFVTTVKPE